MSDEMQPDAAALAELRGAFDALDRELLELLNRRAGLSLRMGALKTAAGLAVHDPAREKKVVERLQGLNRGPLTPSQLAEIYACIFKASRELQGNNG